MDDDCDASPHHKSQRPRQRHDLLRYVASVAQKTGLNTKPSAHRIIREARCAISTGAAIASALAEHTSGAEVIILLIDEIAVRVARVVEEIAAIDASSAGIDRAIDASSGAAVALSGVGVGSDWARTDAGAVERP